MSGISPSDPTEALTLELLREAVRVKFRYASPLRVGMASVEYELPIKNPYTAGSRAANSFDTGVRWAKERQQNSVQSPAWPIAMTDIIRKIETARVRAAEAAAVASLPAELLENMRHADAAYAASGGCPGCHSKTIGVHHGACPELDKPDFY